MYTNIEYLKDGSHKQKVAYACLEELGIMEDLKEFQPLLCGTIPIDIAISSSDLDIIVKVPDILAFEQKIRALYENKEGFKMRKCMIREEDVIIINFRHNDFEIEIFGENVPVKKQYAYLHMMIEKAILESNPKLKNEIVHLKRKGFKTEPAFCKVLSIPGEPYEALLEYGREHILLPKS